MSELKTKPNRKRVRKFIENVENAQRRSNSLIILVKMEEITGEKAVMWGDSLVGFGRYD